MWWSTRLPNMIDAYIYVSLPFRKRLNHSYNASFHLKISYFIHERLKNQTFISQTIRQSIPPSPYRPLWALSTSSITNKYVLFLETITSLIGCDEMGIFCKTAFSPQFFGKVLPTFPDETFGITKLHNENHWKSAQSINRWMIECFFQRMKYVYI